jgi:hypothetical protein
MLFRWSLDEFEWRWVTFGGFNLYSCSVAKDKYSHKLNGDSNVRKYWNYVMALVVCQTRIGSLLQRSAKNIRTLVLYILALGGHSADIVCML